MQSRNTDDIETILPRPEPQAEPARFVDIHIYPMTDEDEQETKTIEATLDEISQANQPPDEWQTEQSDTSPMQPGRKLSPIVLVLVAILLLALLGKAYLYLVPLLTPTTTITIIPVSQQIQTTRTIQVVTGQGNATNQIAGRPLATITLSQAQTVPTTGLSHQEAQPAHGTITFYNNAPYVQFVPSGMLLTGKSGTHYTTDQPATIAAAAYPAFGQATVSAHTIITGPTGNQPSGDIYGPCCLLNLSAVSSAFMGGQDGRDYQTVSNQDVSSAADSLKASLTHSASAALETQVQQGESLVAPSCTSNVTSNHQIGDEATQVTITVEQQCSTLAYQKDALQALMQRAITEQAMHQLGTSYTQIGDSTVTIKEQQTDTTGTSVQVQARGVWYAQFPTARLSTLARGIAGKSKTEATRILLHTTGVEQVEGLPDTLPTDPAHIRVLILYAQREV